MTELQRERNKKSGIQLLRFLFFLTPASSSQTEVRHLYHFIVEKSFYCTMSLLAPLHKDSVYNLFLIYPPSLR